jgi:putative nucleotidyltransferase with HDIG domain
MTQRIALSQLRPGMYVSGVPGAWIEHALWRTRFLVRDENDIERLRRAGVAEVLIDPTRGEAADNSPAAVIAAPPAVEVALPAAPPPAASVPFASEVERAARIYRAARPRVLGLFNEARLGQAIDSAGAVALVDEINASVTRNAAALVSIARLKSADEYTFMHSVAVCALMIALARQLSLDETAVRAAGLAGLLHDLGKASLPIEVLNKPGRLTEDEFALVRSHPQQGCDLLHDAGIRDAVALDVCLHHHEKLDGSGYPEGLAGAAISRMARMGAICDVYDAITSDRPYKRGWDPAESIRKMGEWCGNHFDPEIFKAFVRSVGIYPVGALVRLASGRLAVVVEQNPVLTTPRVKVMFSTRSQLHIAPEEVDLSRSNDRIVAREDARAWGLTHLDELWAGEAARRG